MKLGTEVGLGPGHTVFDGNPARLPMWHSPQFLADVRCGQTAGWIKMPLSTEVGLGPGHIVLDGTQVPKKGTQQPPIFSPCVVVAKRLDGSRCHLVLR